MSCKVIETRRTGLSSIAVSVSLLSLVLPYVGGCRGIQKPKGGQQPVSIFSVFSPPSPAIAAAWATDEYDADKRYRGILLLANAPFGGEQVYVDMYSKAADDEDPGVRSAAIRGLALHGSPEHVPIILRHLEDPDRLLRWECARALQRIHSRQAVPALLKRIDEKVELESQIRAAAASALGQYPEERVLDGLIASIRERDLAVNLAAQDSLRTLTGQDFRQDFRAWVNWRKESQKPFAGQRPYIYPVFVRDRNLLEILVPIFRPPNEIAGSPVGLDIAAAPPPSAGPSADSSQPSPEPVRNN